MEAITREEMLMSGVPLEPITRKELFLAKAAGMDVQTPEPITREEMFLSMIQGGSGGGSAPIIEPLSVTENGTYEAPEGVDGYSPVTVNVASGGGDEWEERMVAMIEGSSANPVTELPAGITKIGMSAFQNNWSIKVTALPDGITSIGNNAFNGCGNLAISSIPNSVSSIGKYAFGSCGKITLESIPAGVTDIQTETFAFCKSITKFVFHSSVNIIEALAFYGCSGLTNVTFMGKPSSIGLGIFNSCTNLLTINVPWAEGEVANAPWGATNATINYNYTGG